MDNQEPATSITGFGYYHSCVEIFETIDENLQTCSQQNCEDPKCSNQYSLVQTNTADHSRYLGHQLSCETSTLYSIKLYYYP